MDHLKEIKEILECAYDGANAMNDIVSALKIARALAALNAPVNMDIFTEEFNKSYIEQECK